jgi:hypothetical protein
MFNYTSRWVKARNPIRDIEQHNIVLVKLHKTSEKIIIRALQQLGRESRRNNRCCKVPFVRTDFEVGH